MRRRHTKEAVYCSWITIAIGIFTNKIRQDVLYYNCYKSKNQIYKNTLSNTGYKN